MMLADVDIIVSAYKMMFTWLLEMVYYTEDADMITRWRSHLSAAVLAILHQHRELEIILRLRLNPAFVLKIWNLVFVGKIFFWHYSIKIIENFLLCFLLLNWFFSIKSIRSFSNRKMSIINRKNSIKFQNIWQNSICYKALCCQKVKVQNWLSWLSWLWLSL